MKKQYFEPKTEIVCAYAACAPVVISGGTADGASALAKSREDEDEEAYAVTGGEGEASYGDLW